MYISVHYYYKTDATHRYTYYRHNMHKYGRNDFSTVLSAVSLDLIRCFLWKKDKESSWGKKNHIYSQFLFKIISVFLKMNTYVLHPIVH